MDRIFANCYARLLIYTAGQSFKVKIFVRAQIFHAPKFKIFVSAKIYENKRSLITIIKQRALSLGAKVDKTIVIEQDMVRKNFFTLLLSHCCHAADSIHTDTESRRKDAPCEMVHGIRGRWETEADWRGALHSYRAWRQAHQLCSG